MIALLAQKIPQETELLENSHLLVDKPSVPLCYAIRYGRIRVVRYMLENGFDPNIQSRGQTPLSRAAGALYPKNEATGSTIIEMLLEAGAEPSYETGSVVKYIVMNPYINIIPSPSFGQIRNWSNLRESLIDEENNANFHSPAYLSLHNADWRIRVGSLLEAQALYTPDQMAEIIPSIIEIELKLAHSDPEILALCRPFLDLPLSEETNEAWLTLALENMAEFPDRGVEKIAFLSSIGVDFNSYRTERGQSLLMRLLRLAGGAEAVGGEDRVDHFLEMASAVLDGGGEIDFTDEYGRTALHQAFFWGRRTKTLEFILSSGVNLDRRDADGFLPLHYAFDLAFKSGLQFQFTMDGPNLATSLTYSLYEGVEMVMAITEAMQAGTVRYTSEAFEASGEVLFPMDRGYGCDSAGFLFFEDYDAEAVSLHRLYFSHASSMQQYLTGGGNSATNDQYIRNYVEAHLGDSGLALMDGLIDLDNYTEAGQVEILELYNSVVEDARTALDAIYEEMLLESWNSGMAEIQTILKEEFSGDYPPGCSPMELAEHGLAAYERIEERVGFLDNPLAEMAHLQVLLVLSELYDMKIDLIEEHLFGNQK